MTRAPNLPLPGDLPMRDQIERMVRVNHAGEYGAKRIYQGQLAILEKRASGNPSANANIEKIRHMAEQEQQHLDGFSAEIAARRVRPTALLPVWHVAGFALGAVTTLLGDRAAMACTIAVEEVIDQHYAQQLEQLKDNQMETPLAQRIEQYRAEELEHRDIAVESGGRDSPFTLAITTLVRAGSKAAIYLSERI